jgi:hypothetical protein
MSEETIINIIGFSLLVLATIGAGAIGHVLGLLIKKFLMKGGEKK